MKTFFLYRVAPKHPRQFEKFMQDLGAEKFSENSYIVKTDQTFAFVFGQAAQWIQREGFLFMIDSDLPDQEKTLPSRRKDRNDILRSNGDLDITVRRFRDQFPKKLESFPSTTLADITD